MRELSLFTGAGGGILGTKLLGWELAGCVEWDDYCQRILRQRQEDGHIETAPIFSDIRAFISEGYARRYRGMVDVITAGFPCQPFSVAGKQAGEDDPRNMWPATIECIRMVQPRYAFMENVPGLLNSGYFGRILGDLAESGYDVRWRVLSAAEVGAPHKRDRLWIYCDSDSNSEPISTVNGKTSIMSDVADSRCGDKGECSNSNEMYSERDSEKRTTGKIGRSSDNGGTQNVAYPKSIKDSRIMHNGYGKQDCKPKGEPRRENLRKGNERERTSYWSIEPNVGRVANGVASRVDRLKAIGNGQVPAVVRAAWELLAET